MLDKCIFKKGTRIVLMAREHDTKVTFDPTGGFGQDTWPDGGSKISLPMILNEMTANGIAFLIASGHGLGADTSLDVGGGWHKMPVDNVFSFVLV